MEQARQLATRGIELFHAGRAAEAYEQIERAERLYPALTHRVYLARALAEMGRWVDAKARYDAIQAEGRSPSSTAAEREAYAVAASEADALEAKIPTIRLSIRGDFTDVTIDGEAIDPAQLGAPILVDPGPHRVEVRAGEATAMETFSAVENERRELGIHAPATEMGEVTYLPAAMAYGVGGISLVVGAVTGGVSLSKVSSFSERCVDLSCPPEDEPEADAARALGTASTVSFVVGGVAVAAGVAFTIWAPGVEGDEAQAIVLTPALGPGWVGIGGSF